MGEIIILINWEWGWLGGLVDIYMVGTSEWRARQVPSVRIHWRSYWTPPASRPCCRRRRSLCRCGSTLATVPAAHAGEKSNGNHRCLEREGEWTGCTKCRCKSSDCHFRSVANHRRRRLFSTPPPVKFKTLLRTAGYLVSVLVVVVSVCGRQ